jgi:hypothetical protein
MRCDAMRDARVQGRGASRPGSYTHRWLRDQAPGPLGQDGGAAARRNEGCAWGLPRTGDKLAQALRARSARTWKA